MRNIMSIANAVIEKTRHEYQLPEPMAVAMCVFCERAQNSCDECHIEEPKMFIGSGEDVCLA